MLPAWLESRWDRLRSNHAFCRHPSGNYDIIFREIRTPENAAPVRIRRWKRSRAKQRRVTRMVGAAVELPLILVGSRRRRDMWTNWSPLVGGMVLLPAFASSAHAQTTINGKSLPLHSSGSAGGILDRHSCVGTCVKTLAILAIFGFAALAQRRRQSSQG